LDGVTVGIDFVDRNARLAAEYMRGLVAGARASAPEPASHAVSTDLPVRP
jgi:hypothetical protein